MSRLLRIPSPQLGRPIHVWCFGEVGRPIVVFPSNAGVAHEWMNAGMIDALGPLLAAGRAKIYCVETNVSRSFSGEGSLASRMAHHAAYERFVLDTLVPFIWRDSGGAELPLVAAGCSVGALYTALFVLKHPEVFRRGLCLSGRYVASRFFDGHSSDELYFNDPMAFVPNLHGTALDRVRHAHLTVVVGRGAHEGGCLPETAEFGALLQRKGIPAHVAFWGRDSSHTYPWWQRQAAHYLPQLV